MGADASAACLVRREALRVDGRFLFFLKLKSTALDPTRVQPSPTSQHINRFARPRRAPRCRHAELVVLFPYAHSRNRVQTVFYVLKLTFRARVSVQTMYITPGLQC